MLMCVVTWTLLLQLEPWNVDTISKEGFTKTLINKDMGRKDDNLSEEEKEKRMKEFVKKNEVEIKKYGMFRNYDDSRRYLMVCLILLSFCLPLLFSFC